MLTKKIEESLNKEVNAEFYSAYLYLSMSAYFERQNMKGFANWMKVQYQEELAHALHIVDYINGRGGRVKLVAITAPKHDWKNSIEVFTDTLKHEVTVTDQINELVDISLKEKDHATVNILQWFVSEQVEEEANVSEILQQLKIIEGKGPGLFMIDRELKMRVFVDPFANTGNTAN
jgi:ferritin